MTRTAMTTSDPRWHYVSIRRGTRAGLLAGPFPTRAEALRWEPRVRRAATVVDPFAAFDAFGTCLAPTRRPGLLNTRLGVRVAEPWS